MTAGKKRRIKRRLSGEKPTIWIGKNGASQELIKEINKQLEKEEVVKVKILKSALAEGQAKQIDRSLWCGIYIIQDEHELQGKLCFDRYPTREDYRKIEERNKKKYGLI